MSIKENVNLGEKPVRKKRKRELLIRGNFPKNPISELTSVVEELYTTNSILGPGSNRWLFFDEKGTRSTWFTTSERATGSSNCTWPNSANVPESRTML